MAKVRFTKVLPPTPDEFRARARQEFAFLAGEFGFREVPIAPGYQNPVAVWFENGTTRVVVEGTQNVRPGSTVAEAQRENEIGKGEGAKGGKKS